MTNRTYVNSEFYKIALTDVTDRVIGIDTPYLTAQYSANLGNVANVKIGGGVANQYLQTDGNGNLSFSTVSTSATPPGGGNSQVQFNNQGFFGATSAFSYDSQNDILTVGRIVANGAQLSNITGANITGVVANANYAVNTNVANTANYSNYSGLATTANTATVANLIAGANVVGAVSLAATANTVAGANVTGAVAFATTANIVAGANVSGAVAFATTANSVAGANVSGQVSYAAVANSVAGGNVLGAVAYATTANSVAGANVSGTVPLATVSGTVSTAAQPNITSVGTLTSLTTSGNIVMTNASPLVQFTPTANITATGGTLIFNGGQQMDNNDFAPTANLGSNLGQPTLRWAQLYTNEADHSGNLTVGGVINRTQYRSGEVIKKTAYIQTGFNQSPAFSTGNTTATTFAYLDYTPTLSNSRLVIEYDSQWSINGSGADSWTSAVSYGNLSIMVRQMTFGANVDGQRTTMIFPIRAVYQVPNNATANISFNISKTTGDDTITIINSASFPATLVITEIAP